jgi:plastocyanin
MKVEWNGSLVGPDEFERKHPQLGPFRVPIDGQALKNARTDRSEPAVAVLLGLNPFVHSGSGLITVTEKNHGRSTGNTVRFRTATGIGTEITKALIESASGYSITVTTTDQYTFTIPGISAATESVTYTVTVVSGNPSNHPSYNVGSSNKYAINGSTATADVELTFRVGSTYRFVQSDSSNSGHPLRIYTAADKTGGEYTTGVTTNGTAGSSGAYTEITVASSAPSTLFYQCSVHANMGATITVTDIDLGLNTKFGGEIATVGPVTLES